MRAGPGEMTARGTVASLVVPISASALATIPFFLVGTLGVRIRTDLRLSEAQFGLAITGRFAATALSAALIGRLIQRAGSVRGMQFGAIAVAASSVGLALGTWNLGLLVLFVAMSGLGTAALLPASELWMARRLPTANQGFAFGIKHSGPPVASMLAGFAVPAVAPAIGWRGAFILAAVVAAVFPLVVSGEDPPVPRSTDTGVGVGGDASFHAVLLLAMAAALGAASFGSLATFLVISATNSGVDEGHAGLMFAAGSVASIAVRIAAGRLADRRVVSNLFVASGMLAVGAIGYALLATSREVLFYAAVPLAFCGGWGWTGMFSLAVVRTNPHGAASAFGITQTGTAIGAIAGPSLFGLLAETSYQAAWLLTTGFALLGASGMLIARLVLRRGISARAAPAS